MIRTDFKTRRRMKATVAEWKKLRVEKLGPCRCCSASYAIELHHLVPRGMGGTIGGDDVAENLVPLCQSCHGLVEARDPWASTLLGTQLTRAERAYVTEKKGRYYLATRYGLKEAA